MNFMYFRGVKSNFFLIAEFLLLSAIIVFYVTAFSPGYFTADTLYMVNQALGRTAITNWHPPFATLLFRVFYAITQEVSFFWYCQLALFCGTLIVTLRSYSVRWVGMVVVFLLAFTPPLTTNFAALWKDCLAIIFAIAAFMAMRLSLTRSSHPLFLTSLILLTISAWTRLDYIFVVLPIVFFGVWGRTSGVLRCRFFRASAASVFFVAIWFVGGACFSQAAEVKGNGWMPTAIWDLAGISVRAGTNIFPEKRAGTEVLQFLKENYNCHTADSLWFMEGKPFFNLPEEFQIMDYNDEKKIYTNAWLSAVSVYPALYILHRLCVLKEGMAFGTNSVYYPYPFGIPDTKPFDLEFKQTAVNKAIYSVYSRLSNGFLFRVWYYIFTAVFICFVMIIIYIMYGLKIKVFNFMIIGTLIGSIVRFVILPASDLRYYLWIIVALILIVGEFIEYIIYVLSVRRNIKLFSVVI